MLVALMLLQTVIDSFDADAVAKHWSAVDSTLSISHEPARLKDGAGSLRWEAKAPKASVSTTSIPADWKEIGAVAFWIYLSDEKDRTLEVELKPKEGPGRFWRKVGLKAQTWQAVELATWQFRADGTPAWSDLGSLRLVLRDGPAALFIDHLRLLKGDASAQEPAEALSNRAFGAQDGVAQKTTKNFRVFTNAPLDLDKLSTHLDEFLKLFQKTMGLRVGDLERPVTLVIHKTRAAYVEFAVRTARDVYGAEANARSINSDGYTFFDYSFCSYHAERGEKRPVFFHEVTHQLVTRSFGLRGAAGATWVEEGLCYFLQNEFLPQEDLAGQVGEMLANRRRPKLTEFEASIQTGLVNLQALTLVAFLVKGKHSGKLGDLLPALSKEASLPKAVDAVLKIPLADFESEWLEWCRENYKP
jgi:hypothetical protein